MNKYLNLFFILFVSSLTLGFTSCSDDDEDPDYAKEIVGNYKGTIEVPEMGPIPDAQISISPNGVNKVKLTMNQDLGITVVDVEVESTVTVSNNLFRVSGSTVYELGGVPLPVTVSGTIDGNMKANIDISITGMFTVTFEGSRQ